MAYSTTRRTHALQRRYHRWIQFQSGPLGDNRGFEIAWVLVGSWIWVLAKVKIQTYSKRIAILRASTIDSLDCVSQRLSAGGRNAIKLRNLYKVFKKRICRKTARNPSFSRAFGAFDKKIFLTLFHQPGRVAAETTHEGASLEGTKAASLAPAFDIGCYKGKNY